VRYWNSRLIQRKYCEQIKFTAGHEYSTRIEHEGTRFFFPLGSGKQDVAAATALKIYRSVLCDGWKAACACYPREIAVAIFWWWSPIACTYTTLYTFVGNARHPARDKRPPSRKSCRVAVIEEEEAVRRSLEFWVNRQPGFHCALACSDVSDAIGRLRRDPAQIVLVNRELVERPGGAQLDDVRAALPDVPVFCFGIYEESNYIFHSVTGVKAGYLLHRRPPRKWFEPVARLAREPRLPATALAEQIKRYFQGLFELPVTGEPLRDLADLTNREHEILICLSKGFTDKEIADALSISVWTVHGHVKRVFEKLGVHSRTEAVIKYLQK
jgi:DNA-binding NarL/FixJ family response regulator